MKISNLDIMLKDINRSDCFDEFVNKQLMVLG